MCTCSSQIASSLISTTMLHLHCAWICTHVYMYGRSCWKCVQWFFFLFIFFAPRLCFITSRVLLFVNHCGRRHVMAYVPLVKWASSRHMCAMCITRVHACTHRVHSTCRTCINYACKNCKSINHRINHTALRTYMYTHSAHVMCTGGAVIGKNSPPPPSSIIIIILIIMSAASNSLFHEAAGIWCIAASCTYSAGIRCCSCRTTRAYVYIWCILSCIRINKHHHYYNII